MNKSIKNCIFSFAAGNISFYLWNKLGSLKKSGNDKIKKYYHLFNNWMVLMERGEKIEQYFKSRNIREIAIYGYGDIGRHIVTQLSKTDIHVRYIIDQRKDGILTGDIMCYQIGNQLPDVDAVVVTPIYEYREIEERLKNRMSTHIISMEDIIYELL